ncbi:MAG: hypothetical protein EXR69_05625 [Myxococcales bacterium]|nr:hypothetical protein [Myxococcales bacterium]
MSYALRSLLVLPLPALAMPALAMPVGEEWRDVGSPTTDTTVSETEDGRCTWTTTKAQIQEWVKGHPGTQTVRWTTSLTGDCGAIVGGGGTGCDYTEYDIDATGIGIALLNLEGVDGTVFDVYDGLDNWLTEGVTGEPLEVGVDSILTISAPADSVDSVEAAPL